MNTMEVVKRVCKGRNASNRLRNAGEIPAIIYGGKEAPVQISLSVEKFAPHMHANEKNFKLKLDDGREETVVVKEVQYDALKEGIQHIDFIRVAQKS